MRSPSARRRISRANFLGFLPLSLVSLAGVAHGRDAANRLTVLLRLLLTSESRTTPALIRITLKRKN